MSQNGPTECCWGWTAKSRSFYSHCHSPSEQRRCKYNRYLGNICQLRRVWPTYWPCANETVTMTRKVQNMCGFSSETRTILVWTGCWVVFTDDRSEWLCGRRELRKFVVNDVTIQWLLHLFFFFNIAMMIQEMRTNWRLRNEAHCHVYQEITTRYYHSVQINGWLAPENSNTDHSLHLRRRALISPFLCECYILSFTSTLLLSEWMLSASFCWRKTPW